MCEYGLEKMSRGRGDRTERLWVPVHDKLPCGLSRGVPPRSLPRGFRIKIARIKTVSKPYQTCIKPVSNRIKPYQTVSVSVPWSDCLALTAFTLPTSGLVIDLAA